MSWIYDILSVNTVAKRLGTMEILAALLIAIRRRKKPIIEMAGLLCRSVI